MPTHPDRSDQLQIPIEVGPISLKVAAPRTEQYLKVEWQADSKGYILRATDTTGKPVENAWSAVVISADKGYTATPMLESRDGKWSAVWPDYVEFPMQVEAWIGARGYVAITFKEMVSKPSP